MRVQNQVSAALMRNDATTAAALLGPVPDLQTTGLQAARAKTQFLLKNYAEAERYLRNTLAVSRGVSNFTVMRNREPLVEILAHYGLGQIYSQQGKRDQAIDEYQQFLSHFGAGHSTLPEVETARTALKQLMQ